MVVQVLEGGGGVLKLWCALSVGPRMRHLAKGRWPARWMRWPAGSRRRARLCLVALWLSLSGCAAGQALRFQAGGRAGLAGQPFAGVPWHRETRGVERAETAERASPREESTASTRRATVSPAAMVSARASGREWRPSEEAACYRALRKGSVRFTRVGRAKARGVEYPIRLTGRVGGIAIRALGRADAPTAYLDCRLARALLAWAPTLRRNGVTGIVHYSMYRKGAKIAGTNKTSAHAGGMAIDAARFRLRSGKEISVLDDWTDQTRGADPCARHPRESAGARLMRRVICQAAARNLFHVIITPHYNRAHHNHVHLEITERGRSTWIR